MKMRNALLALLILTIPVFSQERPSSPYHGLQKALDIYSLGRYDEAYRYFKDLSELYVFDSHHTIFRFMAAKCLFKNGNLDKALTEFNRFIDEFPGSIYLSGAYLYLGHIDYLKRNYAESAVNYIKAYDSGPKSKAAQIALANFEPLLEKELTIDEISLLLDDYPQSLLTDEIIYYLGKRHYDMVKYKRAAKVFEKYLNNFPDGKYISEVKKFYIDARVKADKKIIIGVLAPLTGSYAEYGLCLVEGVKLVFDELAQVQFKEIELIIKDTQGSPVQATQAVKELVIDEPVAIIGPLRSESAVGAAVAAGYGGIPLITPTASEQGITRLGQGIYQISPSSEIIATALAEYAVKEMNIKEFGIIAPGDFTGRQVSRAFAQKVYQLGGEVLSSTFYESGQTDFSNQIKPLREILLMKTEEQLAAEMIDSTEYFDLEKEEWLDQEDWRVYLGGLFLPGYPEELALLVPQIRYHVISTSYLGLDGWDSPELVGKIERYVEGSIYATDYRPGAEGEAWEEFYLKYYKQYNKAPTRVAALAYDAAGLVRYALQEGATTPEDVDRILASLENYQGASFVVNFKESDNANNAVSIFQITGKTVAKVK
jgi:ABC-type branched-subunit amino acid transport system substrate-binding protein